MYGSCHISVKLNLTYLTLLTFRNSFSLKKLQLAPTALLSPKSAELAQKLASNYAFSFGRLCLNDVDELPNPLLLSGC